jgi:hypothetical protein
MYGKIMTARELQDILNLLPTGAKAVVVAGKRDCKISASVPEGNLGFPWRLVNEPGVARLEGFIRVIYRGPRSDV